MKMAELAKRTSIEVVETQEERKMEKLITN
jgi:hypothetical protein